MDDLDKIKAHIVAIFSELTMTQQPIQPISEERRRLLESQLKVFWLTVVLAACGVIQIIPFMKELVCGR